MSDDEGITTSETEVSTLVDEQNAGKALNFFCILYSNTFIKYNIFLIKHIKVTFIYVNINEKIRK